MNDGEIEERTELMTSDADGSGKDEVFKAARCLRKRRRKTEKTEFAPDVKTALKLRAVGYDVKETVEEYAIGDCGEQQLVKRKVSVKHIPPELTACKSLLEKDPDDVRKMTDAELEKERLRLIGELSSAKWQRRSSKLKKKSTKEKVMQDKSDNTADVVDDDNREE